MVKYIILVDIIQETIKWNLNHQDWINHVESGEYMKWMERYN